MAAAPYYATPQTFLEIIKDACDMLEKSKDDVSVTKKDVIDSMEDRLSFIMGKLIAVPTHTSFALFRSNAD